MLGAAHVVTPSASVVPVLRVYVTGCASYALTASTFARAAISVYFALDVVRTAARYVFQSAGIAVPPSASRIAYQSVCARILAA